MGKRVHKRCYDIRKIQSQAIMSSIDNGGTRYVDDNFWCISKGNTLEIFPRSLKHLQVYSVCRNGTYVQIGPIWGNHLQRD